MSATAIELALMARERKDKEEDAMMSKARKEVKAWREEMDAEIRAADRAAKIESGEFAPDEIPEPRPSRMSEFEEMEHQQAIDTMVDAEVDRSPFVEQQAIIQPDAPHVTIEGIAKTYASLCAILRHDRRIFPEPLRWNEMLCCPTSKGEELPESTTGRVREQVELDCADSKGKPLRFSPGDVDMAIAQIAQERRYHPVKDYLSGLQWDRVGRISGLCGLLGVAPSPYHLAILRRWMIGCVARIFKPGCDLQMVLVLTGREDAGKSRFFAQIAGEHWFSDETIDIKDKDAKMLLQRIWFWEWGELEQISAKDWPSRKSFITSRDNDFRTPYGRTFKRYPRHCVIPSTANEDRFLVGRDGERRFWPIRIPDGVKIKCAQVAAQRDQLWAEAVHLFQQKEQWHLLEAEKPMLRASHAHHVEEHPWASRVADWAATFAGSLTTSAVLEHAIGKPPKDWTRGDQMAVATVMRAIGYPVHAESDAGRERVWKKIES